jgi:hypothetical protein
MFAMPISAQGLPSRQPLREWFDPHFTFSIQCFLRRGSAHRFPRGEAVANRLFGTDSLTDEECGRQRSDFGNVKTSTGGYLRGNPSEGLFVLIFSSAQRMVDITGCIW